MDHQEVIANRMTVFIFSTDDCFDHTLITKITGLTNDSHVINLKSSDNLSLCMRCICRFIYGWHKMGDPTINNGFDKQCAIKE